jgi:MoaA/NifB/PqqE/SkfB family radical SAM enzyme
VRQAEQIGAKNEGSFLNEFIEKSDMDASKKLPPPLSPKICSLKDLQDMVWDGDAYNPSIECLSNEVEKYMKVMNVSGKVNNVSTIVFAGEGEPTLRLDDMIRMAINMRALEATRNVPMRLVTNGLCDEKNAVLELKDAGITSLSVALMTSSSAQYDDLMQPVIPDDLLENDVCAHQMVCNFIKRAVESGLDVEVTGVERSDVDKIAAQRLSSDLGVVRSFRWRPFFP